MSSIYLLLYIFEIIYIKFFKFSKYFFAVVWFEHLVPFYSQ